jgi:hypothetical protein
VALGRSLRARNVPLSAGKQLLCASNLLGEPRLRRIAMGCEQAEDGVPMAGLMGVEDSTEQDEVVPSYGISYQLVTLGGTPVESLWGATVTKEIAGGGE